MASITHSGPVNPAQVIAALGVESCVVSHNDDDGTFGVAVPGVGADRLRAAVAGLTYDATVGVGKDPTADLTTRLEALRAKASPTVKDVLDALLGTTPGAVGQVAAQARGPQ